MVPDWFSSFFMVPDWFFMVPGRFSWFSWFQVGFSWFQVGFHGFFYSSRLVFHGFSTICTRLNNFLARRSSLGPPPGGRHRT